MQNRLSAYAYRTLKAGLSPYERAARGILRGGQQTKSALTTAAYGSVFAAGVGEMALEYYMLRPAGRAVARSARIAGYGGLAAGTLGTGVALQAGAMGVGLTTLAGYTAYRAQQSMYQAGESDYMARMILTAQSGPYGPSGRYMGIQANANNTAGLTLAAHYAKNRNKRFGVLGLRFL